MARPSTKDPLDKFRWMVEIDGFTRSGFTICETPSVSINTQKYIEGGNHLFPRQIVDSVEYRPVALERGVSLDMNFHKWAKSSFELVSGTRESYTSPLLGTANPEQISVGTPVDYRRDVIISHLNRQNDIVKQYILYNAFPIEYRPASDFGSDLDDTLSMERLVLAYESFEVVVINEDTNPIDPTDLIKRIIRKF